MGLFAVDFRGTARNWWVYWSVIGHRFAAKGRRWPTGKGKVQERCRVVWIGVEMWERGTPKMGDGSGRRERNLIYR